MFLNHYCAKNTKNLWVWIWINWKLNFITSTRQNQREHHFSANLFVLFELFNWNFLLILKWKKRLKIATFWFSWIDVACQKLSTFQSKALSRCICEMCTDWSSNYTNFKTIFDLSVKFRNAKLKSSVIFDKKIQLTDFLKSPLISKITPRLFSTSKF